MAIPQDFIKNLLNREWRQYWKPTFPEDFYLDPTKDSYLPNARNVRYMMQYTMATFLLFAGEHWEHLYYLDPFSKMIYCYHQATTNGDNKPASDALGSVLAALVAKQRAGPEILANFEKIKNATDDTMDRSAWISAVDGQFKEYRASAMIQLIVEKMWRIKDLEVEILFQVFVDLRVTEVTERVGRQWRHLLNAPTQFQKWALAVLLAPIDFILPTFEQENFYYPNIWNTTKPEGDFMDVNVGLPFLERTEARGLSRFQVQFHVDRFNFWLNNSRNSPKALIELMNFCHAYVIRKEVWSAKNIQSLINRHQHAIHLLHRLFSRECFTEEQLIPFDRLLENCQEMMSMEKLKEIGSARIVPTINFQKTAVREALYEQLRVVDFLMIPGHNFTTPTVQDIHVKFCKGRQRQAEVFVDYINSASKIALGNKTDDEEMVSNWFKTTVKEVVNWKESLVELVLR